MHWIQLTREKETMKGMLLHWPKSQHERIRKVVAAYYKLKGI